MIKKIVIVLYLVSGLCLADTKFEKSKATYFKNVARSKKKYEDALRKHRAVLQKDVKHYIKRAMQKGDMESATAFTKFLAEIDESLDVTDALSNMAVKEPTVKKLASIPLIKLKAKSSTVGFSVMTLNANHKGEQPLIDGKICNEFIYAHAPSSIRYKLPAGTNYFTAKGGSFMSKSVSFKLLADGKEFYSSKVLSEMGNYVDIAVKVPPRSKIIDLVVDDAGNFQGDTSYWAYPRFERVKFIDK